MHATLSPVLDAIEDAARQAAVARATGTVINAPSRPEPTVLEATSENEGIAAVLRHRLGLDDHVRLSVYEDANHPLFPAARRFRAARIQLSHGRRRYIFIATYEDGSSRLCFSLIAPCHACLSPVPSVVIDTLADFGDWLIGARDQRKASLCRSSPAHRTDCPVHGN
ncbi:hypothetical protein MHW47_06110 [Streptomyces sp. OfavH-34-F]|uniref:hypothetical protein n=1 Tax=Streptomyces sp. OfavH-34-F TaxID=2917760 RepID=UPI001EF3D3E4|nr:hypothetical protein [Streptomyces sp. OfavH-34-F]MCG7524016.1 hypothetical protein [Streptomyces sp. OfavH-34-F]